MARSTDFEKEIYDACVESFEYFAETFLRIKDKEGNTVPLILNAAQQYIHDQLEAQWFSEGRVRALILKGRQQGCSTLIAARYYWHVWRSQGLEVFILTHEDKATEHIFSIVQRYNDLIDPRMRPRTGKSNAKELWFEVKDSSYGVGTARTKGTGRSQTVHRLHWSEVSHSANQAEHAAGIMQTVPDASSEIILETTANGVGDLFHQRWQDPRSDYLKIFVPWYWQAEYRAPAEPGMTLTLEEAELAEEHGLDYEQLAWRRRKISDLGSTDLFRQEYPNSPEEAFLYSGGQYFPTEALRRIRGQISKPTRGVLEATPVSGRVRFVEQSNGWLDVWERPDEKGHYVVGVDVAEGLPHGDLSVGQVLRRGDVVEQVARISPAVEPDDLGRYAVLLCEWYGGNVPLAIERNSLGIAAVISARDTEYRHLFQMPTQEGVDNDPSTHKFGWITSVASRPIALNDLLAAVRDGGLVVRSEDTLKQMETFVRGKNGKPEGAEGCLDDDVLAISIAYQMIQRTVPVKRLDTHREQVRRYRQELRQRPEVF